MKKKGNHKGNILQDHKKVGQRLIPPMMQLENIKETSFREDTLPCLIWISAIFLRLSNRQAANIIVDFVVSCDKTLEGESPRLAFLNNYNELSPENKRSILDNMDPDMLEVLRENLVHQYHLIKDYPLAFLFDGYEYSIDRDEAIDFLTEDVDALLNRYTQHSTKVQTTAYVSLAATKKIFISSKIDMPDLNCIFTAPNSDDAKKVASFVRASLNAGAGMLGEIEEQHNLWAASFWKQAFDLRGCENE